MPAYVSYTGKFVSEYINMDMAELSKILEENFKNIMGVSDTWK